MLVEVVEQRPGLLLGPAVEANREGGVHVEHLAAGVGVANDHRVHGVLHCLLGVAETVGHVRIGLVSRPEHVTARMHRLELREHVLHAVRQRLPGEAHIGEHRVAAGRRDLEGVDHGAQRGRVVVGMIGVPLVADVLLLVGFLADLGDLRVTVDGREEPVDVDVAEAARGGHVLLGREVLIADHDHAALVESRPDAVECLVVDTGREVDAEYLGSQRSRDRPNIHLHVSHRHVSR